MNNATAYAAVAKTNARAAACMQCGTIIAPGMGIATPVKSDGNKSRYICEACNSHYNDASYGRHATAAARGKQAGHGITYAVELELHGVDAVTRAELAKVGYIATADCTTDVEFKSAPRGNMNNHKTWNTLEQLLKDGHAAITPDEGTHIHMGAGAVVGGEVVPGMINARTMNVLADNYRIVFKPLFAEMAANPVDTVRLFGRWFNGYCSLSHASGYDKYSAINTCHDNTIEYRLCKFRTAEQWKHLLKTLKAMTECIVTNYLVYIGEVSEEKLAYKADVTGRKLARLYTKAAAAAPTWTDAQGVTAPTSSGEARCIE